MEVTAMLTTAGGLVLCGTVLEPTGAGAWGGSDSVCSIRCELVRETWTAELELPGHGVIASGRGASPEEAIAVVREGLAGLLRSLVGLRSVA